MTHTYSNETAYYRCILSWFLLLLIVLVALAPIFISYQNFKNAEHEYRVSQAFAIIGGDPFRLFDEKQIVELRYSQMLFSLTFVGIVAVIVVVIAMAKLTSFHWFKWRHAKEIEILNAPELYGCVFDLARTMEIDPSRITLWLDNSNERTPSCTTRWGRVHLMCPLGFIKLLTDDPASVKAMLAHELGHVLNRDTSLWRVAGVVRYCVVFYMCITVLIIAIFALAMLLGRGGNPQGPYGDHWMLSVIVYAIFIAIQLGACKLITYSKRKSELVADIVASRVLTPAAVIGAVEKYHFKEGPKQRFFRSHPTPAERIINIKDHCTQLEGTTWQVEKNTASFNYFRWALRQLYLSFYRPSRFQDEVHGEESGQPKLTKEERYIYVVEMLPWMLLVAHLNNFVIGTLLEFIGLKYNWSLSWIAVEVGLVAGISLGLWFAAESDVVITVGSGITYGSLAGTLLSATDLFSSGNQFMGAAMAILLSSAFAIGFDYIDKEPDEGLYETIFSGVGAGIVLGLLVGIVLAGLEALGFIFNRDYKLVFQAFWQGFVGAAIPASITFYFIYFRLLYYPVELILSLLAFLRSKDSKESVIKAWRMHAISWNEVSRLPLPFITSLLIKLARHDRQEALRQIGLITERRFHARAARSALEAFAFSDLQAGTIEEIANVTNKLSWTHEIPSKSFEYLATSLWQFARVSQLTARYLYLLKNDSPNIEELRPVLKTLQALLVGISRSEKSVATRFGDVARSWRSILAAEQMELMELERRINEGKVVEVAEGTGLEPA